MEEQDNFEAVYAFVRSVPPGKVVTYGQVAGMVEGVSLTARQVGAAMHVAPKDVPWQRVVGAGGALPIAKRNPDLKKLQRRLLEQEGVRFLPGEEDRVDMARCQWRPQGQETEQGSLFAEEE
ncbi:MAG TPA: MGMT family protein [Chthonomonadaceae bacterium]|nr:MGMT family protein [Chthonomonadaceae bacterium]